MGDNVMGNQSIALEQILACGVPKESCPYAERDARRQAESHARSIAKGVSHRVFGTLGTVALVYMFTGDAKASLSLGVVEAAMKLVIYYGHERLWNVVPWGRYQRAENAQWTP